MQVGLLLLPLGIGMLTAYPSMGWLTKHCGIRNVAAGGALISPLSRLPFLYLAPHRMVGPIFLVSLFLRGIRQGAIAVPSLSAAYRSVPKDELPMATTTMNIAQRLGGPIFTTMLATFLAWRMQAAISPEGTPAAFMLAFLVPGGMQLLLLASTLRLPGQLPLAAQ